MSAGMRLMSAVSVVALTMTAAPAMAAGNGGERVTFTKDILPILQENCQNCHRQGGQNVSGMIAPMSLTTYREVRPWSKALLKAVADGQMPPWHASADQHGIFKNERTLTKDEIATIAAWVKQGAARGNPKDAPEPVQWREGWWLGEPDLELSFPEPFFVEDDVQDLYHDVTIQLTKEQLPEDKWVTAWEFLPGSEVVHHIVTYTVDPELEDAPENTDVEGVEDFLRNRVMIGALAPGTDPGYYPEGYAFPLKQGSEMIFSMHYHKEAGPGTGVWDNSVMALHFADEKPEFEMRITNIAHGAFEIPPNHPDWYVVGAETFEQETILLNLFPHMHLRGKWSRYTAFYPDGTSEVLVETPNYDFNWQEYYHYAEPKTLPAGTRIEFEMKFDNSPENGERVGFNSNRAVKFGGPTTDEMDLGWYTYANADGSTPDVAFPGADD